MRRITDRAGWLVALLCAAWTLAPARAAAQSVDCDSEAHRRGRALRTEGLHEQAYQQFRALYAREQSACALARMGQALHALQRWVEAERALAQAVTRTQDPWVAQVRAPLEQELNEVRAHLGELTVTPPPGVPRAELWLDGARVGALPLPDGVWLAAGPASFEVRAPDYQTERRTVTIRAGGSYHEAVLLHRVGASSGGGPEPRRATPVVSASAGPRLVAPAIVSLGAAGALAIVSGVLVGVAQQRYDAYLACATETAGAETLCPAQREDANTWLRVSYAGFGLAGAAVVTGVVLLVADAPHRERHARAGFACAPALGGLGVGCGGRF